VYLAIDDTTAIGSPTWASAVSLSPGAGTGCAVHGDDVALIGGDALEEFGFDGSSTLAPGTVSGGPYTAVQWEADARMLIGPNGVELRPEGGIAASSPASAVDGRFAIAPDGTYYLALRDGGGGVSVAWGAPGALVQAPLAMGLAAADGVDIHVAADGRVWVAAVGGDALTVAVLTPL
jgi:hypothetical protein